MTFIYILFISTVIGYIYHTHTQKPNRNEINASNIKYKKYITLTMKNDCIDIYIHIKQILDHWVLIIWEKIHLNITNHRHC